MLSHSVAIHHPFASAWVSPKSPVFPLALDPTTTGLLISAASATPLAEGGDSEAEAACKGIVVDLRKVPCKVRQQQQTRHPVKLSWLAAVVGSLANKGALFATLKASDSPSVSLPGSSWLRARPAWDLLLFCEHQHGLPCGRVSSQRPTRWMYMVILRRVYLYYPVHIRSSPWRLCQWRACRRVYG